MDANAFETLEAEVECVRFGKAIGPTRLEPTSYAEYQAPAHRTKLLERLNAHDRDCRISFYEGPHIYVVDGTPIEASVTSIIASFMPEFNALKVIGQMKTSKREAWPRLKYAVNVHSHSGLSDVGRSALLYNTATNLTVWAGQPPNVCVVKEGKWTEGGEAWVTSVTNWATLTDLTLFAYERAMTDAEILELWNKRGKEASNMGTECHYLMELWSNSEPTRACQEVYNGLLFVKDILLPLKVKAYRTEWEVHTDESIGIAGSIDWVGVFPDGSLIIVDWKRTGADKHDVHNQWGRTMLRPFTHLDQTDVCKFALQLSMYAYILTHFYNLKVKALAICSIHPDHQFHTFLPYLGEEVEYLCERRRRRVSTRKRLEQEINLPTCELSGGIAWDPICVEGKIYDKKRALLHFGDHVEYTVDATHAEQISKLLEDNTPTESLASALPWKIRIPDKGWRDFVPCESGS